ncbi:hypothetical protein E4U60_004655 [Claviceps pazoutovae]|uniref:Pseudouridine synthase I TruA alpha/beta domain-containing protein n=1 Tax=Claviceps pazoutovae TaxID=1649127 RepID=A0A9P7MHF6_9HYPO|nr:hypothetical protein E4U60_004655 [Claviceps pazoutovae]
MPGETNYNSWSKTGLIQRLREVEGELKRRSETPQSVVGAACTSTHDETLPEDGAPENKTVKGAQTKKRKMDPSRYSTRFIALKLAYLGKNYGGFEFQAMGNQPSIEEELWNALTKACLIFPEDERAVQFECCEYSKCGRTDRGVSAFGQVIGLRVRSNRPLPKKRVEIGGPVSENISGEATQVEKKASSTAGTEEVVGEKEAEEGEEQEEEEEGVPFDDLKDELCYPRILNRLLPDDIRILAWCPSPPADFSARFSCRERQYRYFFTQPAFAPNPAEAAGPPSSSSSSSALQPGWLDIEAMRNAAKRFEGEHDFRNFCKVDPAKQISNFRRRIFESDIVQVRDASGVLPFLQNQQSPCGSSVEESPYPQVYYFHVRGSAFLWHQIRHMVAVLFLVGQRLEDPAVVSELLDTQRTPCRPSYVMAEEVPLVLWDCIFPDLTATEGVEAAEQEQGSSSARIDCMNWIYVGDEQTSNKFGQFGLMESTWRLWRGHKMDELLSAQLLQRISQQGRRVHNGTDSDSTGTDTKTERKGKGARTKRDAGSTSSKVFEGGNGGRLGGKYVPVMKKPLLQSVEEQNDRYARRKGFADAADMKARWAESKEAGEMEE